MDLLIRVYWACFSVMMLEFLSGCVLFGKSEEEDSAIMAKGLRVIKPKLATRNDLDGEVTPGLSIWPVSYI